MEPNYILGATKRLLTNNNIKRGCVVDSTIHDIKTGAPCIILSNEKKKNTEILIPFPSRYYSSPRVTFKFPTESVIVKEVDEVNFFSTIKTTRSQDANEFDIDLTYVKNTGPITFITDNVKCAKLILNKVVHILSNTFKDNTVFYSNFLDIDSNYGKENAALSLTLIDISQCIPIFSANKVEGIMLQIAVNYPNHSINNDILVVSCESILLFSNNKQDLSIVDGRYFGMKFDSETKVKNSVKTCQKYFKNIGENTAKEPNELEIL